eukprot:PhF_6_TR40164/c1_g1_i1/m.59468
MSNAQPKNQESLKIVTLGRHGVGKTSILMRYLNPEPSKKLNSFGSFFTKIINRTTLLPPPIGGGETTDTIKLLLCDTQRQERFSVPLTIYCQGMNIALLCFDVTSQESYSQETFQLDIFNTLHRCGNQSCVVAFVGNKRGEGNGDDDNDDLIIDIIPSPVSQIPSSMHFVAPQDVNYHDRLRVCFYALHVDNDLSRYFLPYDV